MSKSFSLGAVPRTTGASRVGTVIRQISLRRPAGAVQIVAAQIEGCDEASRSIMTDRAAVSSPGPLLQDPKKLILLSMVKLASSLVEGHSSTIPNSTGRWLSMECPVIFHT